MIILRVSRTEILRVSRTEIAIIHMMVIMVKIKPKSCNTHKVQIGFRVKSK